MRRLDAVKHLRVIGFDDAPFVKQRGASVPIVGAVCSNTRFEGMVYGRVRKDGWNATTTLIALLERSKFLPQLHLILLDGIAFGGFNVVDLEALADATKRPCVAVMRKPPNLEAIADALKRLPNPDRRLELLRRAGEIHQRNGFVFQVKGPAEPEEVAAVLPRLTDTGRVPEALRLAHLIGAAVVTGESSKRA